MTKPKRYQDFKDYRVVMHNRIKRVKYITIRKCISGNAACNVAEIKERLSPYFNSRNSFCATDFYELDPEGNAIYNQLPQSL